MIAAASITGLSASTLEIVCFVLLMIGMTLGFMGSRTGKSAWRYLQLGLGLVTVEYQKELSRQRTHEAEQKKRNTAEADGLPGEPTYLKEPPR